MLLPLLFTSNHSITDSNPLNSCKWILCKSKTHLHLALQKKKTTTTITTTTTTTKQKQPRERGRNYIMDRVGTPTRSKGKDWNPFIRLGYRLIRPWGGKRGRGGGGGRRRRGRGEEGRGQGGGGGANSHIHSKNANIAKRLISSCCCYQTSAELNLKMPPRSKKWGKSPYLPNKTQKYIYK